jgi:glycosyltransferase involved in cell wall biosynthesis
MTHKYYFSVGAMFKNESHCLKEWVQHYLYHGADHIYLINDNSDDNFLEIIQEYIDDNKITLFNVNEPYYLGRQRNLYNRHILPHIKETKWLLMVDLDEFIWSPIDINLKNILKNCENFGQIQIRQTIFGSNGHIKQPKYLVKYFTRRRLDNSEDTKFKYIVNTSYNFTSLNIHHADFENKEHAKDGSKFIILNSEYFTNNHYCCQSQEFWNNVKCTRGDGDSYLVRTPPDFLKYDINEIEDLELYKQNFTLFT